MKKGFTLIEILVVIGITAIVLGVAVNSFYNFVKTQALNADYISIASFIDQAKSLSINSKSDSQYGVRFSTSTVDLFKGSSYSVAGSQQTYTLNSRVYISDINLVGGNANEIVFDRLTGYSSASGTVSIALKSASTTVLTMQIYKTGIVEYE